MLNREHTPKIHFDGLMYDAQCACGWESHSYRSHKADAEREWAAHGIATMTYALRRNGATASGRILLPQGYTN